MEREELISRLNEFNLSEKDYEEILQKLCENYHYSDVIDLYNLDIPLDTFKRANLSIFGGKFVYSYLTSKGQDNICVNNTINKDGSQSSSRLIEMSDEQSKDPIYLLKMHGFNSDLWEINSAKNSQWNQNSKTDGLKTLYSSNITVKPKKDVDLSFDKIEEFYNNLISRSNKTCLNDNYLKGDKLLLLDIADLHLNLQASMFTTNNEYDINIACNNFNKVIDDVLSRTSNYIFNKIIFIIGGDMLNADNLQGTTTKGTPQENCLHYYDACEKLYELTINAIDKLSDIAPVDVLYVPGNHDEVTGYKLAKFIQAWYRDSEVVNVDYAPLPRKYYKFGKNLLCFMHDGKVKEIPALISDEARQYWSEVDNVEVFLQHFHTEQVLVENHNIRIQRLPTISGNSKWTNDSGYTAKKQCKSFIFDKEQGLTDVIYTVI